MLDIRLVKNGIIVLIICWLPISPLFAGEQIPAADTIRVTLQQAEQIFLDSNLQLLAQHYNIQSSQALVEQARKWENPVLNTDQNIYANNRFFQHGVDAGGNPQGEIFVQVQQLIKTAGKRGKQIDIARTNVALAEWQFKGIMLSLRGILIKDFYTIARLQGVADLYNDNMQRLAVLQSAMQKELGAGNIARKEFLRVQALIISLQQDMTDNARDMTDAESELKTLLRITGNKYIKPVAEEDEQVEALNMSVAYLMDSARRNNPDYRQEVYQLQYNRQNLSLQRAMAIPDLTLSPEFDQSANYTPQYFGLTLSLPLPLLDRNQGNIKSARFQVKQEEAMLQMADQKLENDVLAAYQKLLLTQKLSSAGNEVFYSDYNKLYKNIVESYNQRQISMLEFLEYFNDYQDVRTNQLQQILNLRLAKEELNDIIGVEVIK